MSDATFQTFLTSGLLVLTAAIGYLAWSAWRWLDRTRDMEKLAVAGIGHELEVNLKRMMAELAGIADGSLRSEIEIVPVVHTQIDALLSRPSEVDRKSLTVMRSNYSELSAHKQTLQAALSAQSDVAAPANVAADAVISSIAAFYLWDKHKGRSPKDADSTRSWHVRDWMKAKGMHADLLPGMHLRDQVVERLRQLGMTLTPQPLTHTASEFYAMQYDRKADPNAPFWKRKPKPVVVEEPEPETIAAPEAELVEEPAVESAAPEQPVPEPMAEPDPAPAPELEAQGEPEAATDVESVEVDPETEANPKPPSSGSLH